MKLAQKCGLNVPPIDFVKALGRSVYLIERFDRDEKGSPIPFLSSLSITGLAENDYNDWSYFKICNAIKKFSSNPRKDLKELFSRIVFNISVYNNDDHMRNHGFLYDKNNKWVLSPLYDVVPGIVSTDTYALSMPFGNEGKKASISNALSRCGEFGLEKNDGQNVCERIQEIVSKWKMYFLEVGVDQKDIKRLENSFKYKS